MLAFSTAAICPAIAAAKKPDLRAIAVSASTAVVAGSDLEVADTTKNSGERRAPGSATGFLLSTNARRDKADLVLEGRRAVAKLQAGKKSSGQSHLRVAPSTPVGRYRLLACADIGLRIAESVESNNCRATVGFVDVVPSPPRAIGPPDPAPDSPRPDGPPPPPAAPTGLATNPLSPAADTTPVLTGVAEFNSTVELFASADCSGPVAASGSAAAFSSPGLEISVAPGTRTRFSARAVGAGGASGCSTPVLYEAYGSRAAFRFTDLDLRDPHVYVNFLGAQDITDTPLGGFSINGELEENLTTDEDEDGFLDMSLVTVFDPFDPVAPTMPAQVYAGAACTAPPQEIVCGPGALPAVATTGTNASAGTCLDTIAGTLTAAYTPEVTTPTAPCFVTDEMTLTLDLAGIPLTLEGTRGAATYVGNPATAGTNGLVRGFLSEAAADATIIPASYPLVGGEPLSKLFPGGKGNPAAHDARDTRSGVLGWWMYLNFTADRTPWVP
jgi:hypothetical protein